MISKIQLDEEALDLIDKISDIYKIKKSDYPTKIKIICKESIKRFFEWNQRLISVLKATFKIIDTYFPHILDTELEITRDLLHYYEKLVKENEYAKRFE